MSETTKTVTISKSVKRVSLQRYLLTRIALKDKVTYRIYAGLIMNQLWLEDKASSDVEFLNKFKGVLETTSLLLKDVNFSQGFSQQASDRFATRIQLELSEFLVPKRNYAQWKSRFDSSVQLKSQLPLGVPTKKLPPKRFIGIGYGDKGTAKKPELDGSQSWQEVAQSDRVLNQEIERLRKYAKDNTNPILKRLEATRRITEIKEALIREYTD